MMAMKQLGLIVAMASVLGGCAFAPRVNAPEQANQALAEMREQAKNTAQDDARQFARELATQLAPKVDLSIPAPVKTPERRFDFNANMLGAPALFQALVDKTGYNLVLSSEVREPVSISLKDVSMQEALEALRDAYGFEFELKGRQLYVSKPAIVSRTFQVNYLTGVRKGQSEVRVISGSVGDSASGGSNGVGNNGSVTTTGGAGSQPSGQQTAKVTTTVSSDFWQSLTEILGSIVGKGEGKLLVVNSQAGLVFVKAPPKEMRDIERYLAKMQNAVGRQVMLEAKIVEVSLKDGAQSGINWGAFDSFARHRFSVGLNPAQVDQRGNPLAGTMLGGTAGILNEIASSTLGLAFTSNSFSALMSFLETQGSTQVLSTPRVATLNNQKAVLKVGNDEFFVTNVSTSTTSSGTSTVSSPSISVQPFFSGISLDVTPQIDEEGYVILHIHPAVSDVFEKNKIINLGTLGSYNLPLASSNVNESDSIVRIKDGQIVAIGGLMRVSSSSTGSKVPLAGDVPVAGSLFKQTNNSASKSELVILIKPTVIQKGSDWDSGMSGLDSQK